MADYRLYPITWKNVIDYNWLQLQITITPCLPPILLKKKLNYVLLHFIKLQFKPKCHGIDTIMYNSLIPFANFGSSQYSILKLIAIHNLACSYVISAVHNIRGKSPVISKYCVSYNTSITSIAGWRILELPVLCVLQH
jgi:hypothetical protein